MEYAAGTSLVVITLTSAVALAVRAGTGVHPDWGLVVVLTAASALGGLLGARLAARTDTRRLSAAFTGLVLAVARLHRGPGTARPRSDPTRTRTPERNLP